MSYVSIQTKRGKKFAEIPKLTNEHNWIDLNDSLVELPNRRADVFEVRGIVVLGRTGTCDVRADGEGCVGFAGYRTGLVRHVRDTHHERSMARRSARRGRCWDIHGRALRVWITTSAASARRAFGQVQIGEDVVLKGGTCRQTTAGSSTDQFQG